MRRFLVGVVAFIFLVWAWPNAVHEPMHYLVLKAQGGSGFMHLDWRPPLMERSPYVTRTTAVTLIGGLFFMLAPHILSAIIFGALWLTRKTPGFLTHIILPMYLVMDIVVNVWHYRDPVSDFHFLITLPHITATVTAMVVMLGGGFIIADCWRCLDGRRRAMGARFL